MNDEREQDGKRKTNDQVGREGRKGEGGIRKAAAEFFLRHEARFLRVKVCGENCRGNVVFGVSILMLL
jgi:hypothetical protein